MFLFTLWGFEMTDSLITLSEIKIIWPALMWETSHKESDILP